VHRPRRCLDRLVLLAYPRSFRRDYGDEITRTVDDLRRHRGVRGWRLGLRITGDILATAPRLRLESAMTRSRVLPALAVVALVTLTAIVAMVLGNAVVFLVPLAVVCVTIIVATRHDRPLAADEGRSHRWAPWAAGGVTAVGVAIGAVAGEDAPEPLWALWAVSTLAGLTMGAIALVVGANQLLHHRSAA